MVCNEESGREKKECLLIGCEGTKHDGGGRQSVSPAAPGEVMKSEESVGHDPSEEERSAEINKRKENILQNLEATGDFGQNGHHSLGSSDSKVERDDQSVHTDQREGVARGAPSREGASEDSLPLRACVTADVSAKRSRDKAESTAGMHGGPSYTSQASGNLHCLLF